MFTFGHADNIPPPGRGGRPTRYPFDKLVVTGDYFEIEAPRISRLYSAAAYHSKKRAVRFSVEKQPTGNLVRVYLTAEGVKV